MTNNSYCPNCGNTAENGDDYCTNCGENLGRDEVDEGEEKRISIDTGAGSDQYYNVSNLSYLQNLYPNFRRFRYPLIFASVLSVLFFSEIADLQVISVAIFIPLIAGLVLLVPSDGLFIGTVAGRDVVNTDDPTSINDLFVEKSPELITVNGAVTNLIYKLDYKYHFVKNNIVGVKKLDSLFVKRSVVILAFSIPVSLLSLYIFSNNQDAGTVRSAIVIPFFASVLLIIGGVDLLKQTRIIWNQFGKKKWIIIAVLYLYYQIILALVIALYQFWQDAGRTFLRNPGEVPAQAIFIISIMLFSLGIIMIIFLFTLPRSRIAISLPSGEEVRFHLTQEDADKLVSQFNRDR